MSLTARALSATFSWRQPYATARSRAISVVGVAISTCWSTPSSIRLGTCSSAALNSASLGRNITTNSGVEENCDQYDFALSFVTCSRIWRP